MNKGALLIVTLLLWGGNAYGADWAALGYSDESTILGPGPDACAGGVLIRNHDDSFESAYAWMYGGQQPPYYGAFAEGYDLGCGAIRCAVCWLATTGYYFALGDCYVWAGGCGAEPGEVLAMVTDVHFNTPFWPEVGQTDVKMSVAVSGPFTVGCWGHWPWSYAVWFCAADLDGPGGHPWTCIAPGTGYPSGWQDPAIVWPAIRSMGFGVYFEQSTPVDSRTWGAIKAMFRR